MKIVVVVKNVYGNSLIYPVCDNAKSFSNLTGKKTLSSYAIRLIEELGYTVELQAQNMDRVQ
jgi:hypothetical protein